MLTDAHVMLIDAHKFQKHKVYAKRFSTHSLRCIFDKNWMIYDNLKFDAFLHFFSKMQFLCYFHAFFRKNQKNQHFWKFCNFATFRREISWSSAFESPCIILYCCAFYEHLRASYEHLRAYLHLYEYDFLCKMTFLTKISFFGCTIIDRKDLLGSS